MAWTFTINFKYLFFLTNINIPYLSFHSLCNNEFFIRYFKYLFRTRQLISLLNTAVSGIREGKNINWLEVCNSPLPIPPTHDIVRMQEDFDKYEHLLRLFEKAKKLLDEYK
jgi:hypothetical protein